MLCLLVPSLEFGNVSTNLPAYSSMPYLCYLICATQMQVTLYHVSLAHSWNNYLILMLLCQVCVNNSIIIIIIIIKYLLKFKI